NPGLRNLVKPGTVLFEGERSGNNYKGTAYLLSSSCPPAAYSVEGFLDDGGRTIVLNGQRPVLGPDCKPVRSTPDRLVFLFQREGGTAAYRAYRCRAAAAERLEPRPGQATFHSIGSPCTCLHAREMYRSRALPARFQRVLPHARPPHAQSLAGGRAHCNAQRVGYDGGAGGRPSARLHPGPRLSRVDPYALSDARVFMQDGCGCRRVLETSPRCGQGKRVLPPRQ